MSEKTLRRNKLTLKFLRWIGKHFQMLFIFIFIWGGLSVLCVGFYVQYLFADKATSQQNVCMSFFSIFAGGATFIGVVLAVSEFRLKFEKITDWKDLLQELTHLVNEAHKYVVMFTFYPTVGMVSQRRGDDFIPEFNDFCDALNVRRNAVKFVCYFLENANADAKTHLSDPASNLCQELTALSTRYRYDDSKFFQEKANKMICDLRNGSSSSHKNVVKEELILDKMSDFHLFISDEEAIIFIPLNLNPGTTTNGGVEFIANATLDLNVISRLQGSLKYQLERMKINTCDLPF